jgi:hypothetical protein
VAAGELIEANARSLQALAGEVRAFLEPHWQAWHAEWGPPPPTTPSQWTCSRSSAFLRFALDRAGIAARVQSGRPSTETGARFGFRRGEGWYDHAWVLAGEWIVDITGDQFGEADIIVTKAPDARYQPGRDADTILPLSGRAEQAVERLQQLWLERIA